MKVNGIDILKNVFFCVQQKMEILAGFELLKNE